MLDNEIFPRQIWAIPSSTSSILHHCTPFTLPSKGVLTINPSSTITLTQNAVFAPECTAGGTGQGAYHASPGDPSSVADLRDPFYASTSPQIYAIAAATVVSYLLVIMLFITPRTFFVGGPGGGSGFLGRRGIITGSYGTSSVVGVGRRPWLQKVAASTVAISLTIATADTFKVAKRQYEVGYMDANALTDEVVGGLEIRIVRVISTTFLWLAQVQTLIRLFPRHKEKVIIKWTGFALIILDTIFSILNSFVDTSTRTRPRTFVDAVPALSYLFELSLSLLYAAWVIYYALCKRRFAFFHTKMRNICLVALLSLSAVLVPVVFFVLDISQPDVAGWGDYIRWVGAAAASVVVWEWVERIEALERDERKDGILGREIFDGDEMLDVTPSAEIDWPRQPRYRPDGPGGEGGLASGWNPEAHRSVRSRLSYLQHPSRMPHPPSPKHPTMAYGALSTLSPQNHPTPPAAAITPVSRTDTTSAASTEYAVRYYPITGTSPPIPDATPIEEPKDLSESSSAPSSDQTENVTPRTGVTSTSNQEPAPQRRPHGELLRWITVNNPFKRRRASPPPEVAIAQAEERDTHQPSPDQEQNENGRWNVKSKIENFAVSQREWLKSRVEGRTVETELKVTVIPAQPRGRTWSPQENWDGTSQEANIEQSPPEGVIPEQDQTSALENQIVPPGTQPSHYVPFAESHSQFQDPPDTSFTSTPPNRSLYTPMSPTSNRILSRRGTLTIAEDRLSPSQIRPAPLPSTTSSRHSYSLVAPTELAPIASAPSSEVDIATEEYFPPSAPSEEELAAFQNERSVAYTNPSESRTGDVLSEPSHLVPGTSSRESRSGGSGTETAVNTSDSSTDSSEARAIAGDGDRRPSSPTQDPNPNPANSSISTESQPPNN